MSWITDRIRERTSWNGVIIGGAALLVLLGIMPLSKMVMWGAFLF